MKRMAVFFLMTFFIAFSGISFAENRPIPISAEQAFNAVQNQTDPRSGEVKNIALVDVRTRAEYFWVGTACQVDKIITTNGESLIPDYGKALLNLNGRFLNFEINGRNKVLQVKKISEIKLSPIAINIPYKLWDENTCALIDNVNFGEGIKNLKLVYNVEVIIFFCRSGERSENCLMSIPSELFSEFDAIYEIDQPDGKNGRGGFEGTSYNNVYNGYRGFPERLTDIQENPSVSWKDAGLPIKTGVNPLNP
jgi:rhodanese-related sulfurtransferase